MIEKQHQVRKFNHALKCITDASPETAEWVNRMDPSKWTMAFDEGARYGNMTTNMLESVNGVLKDTRNLPITALIQSTLTRIVKIFDEHRCSLENYAHEGFEFTKFCMLTMRPRVQKAARHQVTIYDRQRQIYKVVTAYDARKKKGGNEQTVYLEARHCDCGKFQENQIPCSHAIACCMNLSINPYSLIDPCYTLEVASQVYGGSFVPIRHRDYWPIIDGMKWAPNPAQQRIKGRPRSHRIRNEMDWKEPGSNHNVCKKCNQSGHNARSCPNISRDTIEGSSRGNKCKKYKQPGHNSRTCKNVPSV